MAIDVYWGSGSPYAWRVLLALEIKGLEWNSHLIQFSKGEHKAPEFLAMNPRGKVPTLKDGDYVVYESLAVLAYLDAKYPDTPLMGTTPEETGLVWRLISEFSYLEQVGAKVFRPIFFGGVAGNEESITSAMADVHTELAKLEAHLAGREWLAGSQVSAADIAWYPGIQILLRAAGKEEAAALNLELLPFADQYPAISAWERRLSALPGVDKTYPPHWK